MTTPGSAAAAVWVDILPDMSNFGARLVREAAGAGGNAGERLGDEMGRSTQSGFSRHIGKIAAVGAVAGAALGVALVGAMNVEKAQGKLNAQLNLTGKDAERYGRIAGDLYSSNYGDSLENVNEALRQVTLNVGATATASDADLQRITASVLDVATAFDQDLGGTTAAVGQLMKTGLAPDAMSALNIVTAGFQVGVDKSGDFLDTLNEYGGQFQKLGLDGATATGILSQGLQGGARDADQVADALKEFAIRAVDGSETTAAGFRMLGLDGAQMAQAIARGGPEASAALQLVTDELRALPDPLQRSQAAAALFGTQSEDMAAALLTIDPSKAAAGLGDLTNRTVDLGTKLNDNALGAIETFKRSATTAFVDIVGGRILPIVSGFALFLATTFGPALSVVGGVMTNTVIPALISAGRFFAETFGPVLTGAVSVLSGVLIPALTSTGAVMTTVVGPALADFGRILNDSQPAVRIIAGLIAAVFLPHLVALGVTSTVTGIKTAAAWVVTQVSAVRAAVVHSAQVVAMIGRWTLLGAQSLVHAGKVAVSWLIVGGVNAVAAAVGTTVAIAQMIARWLLLGAQSLVHAGRVAAAWVVTSASAVAAGVVMVAQTAVMVARWVFLGAQSLIQAGRVAAAWFISMGPVGWVIATVIGLVALIIANWDKIKAATSALGDSIVGSFAWAVERVGQIWARIKSLTAKPINFLIGTVYNGGIVKAWNLVAGILPGVGPIQPMGLIPEFARGGPVGRDMLLRAGEAGPEYVLSNPAVKALGGLDAVDRWHRELVAQRPSDFMRDLNSGRMVEGADHDGPGSRTTGFGGVKPHVAQAGHFLKNMFGIGSVGGVGQRANASDHPKGLALDFMTYNDQAKGDRLVNYLTPRAGHFAVKYIIWRQRINSGSGWRGMEDRGSATANHFDHPHVSFLPGPGGEGGFSGEGGFFDIKAWIREQLEGITNPVISALRNAFPVPPRFNEIPPSAATAIRDSALDFLLGKAFDSGGLASGRGLMFKNIHQPERVLSPRQTAAFEQLVAQLSGGPIAAPVADRGTADDSDGLGQKFDELIALLRARPFAPITVEDRSGDPGETARSVQLALRMNR